MRSDATRAEFPVAAGARGGWELPEVSRAADAPADRSNCSSVTGASVGSLLWSRAVGDGVAAGLLSLDPPIFCVGEVDLGELLGFAVCRRLRARVWLCLGALMLAGSA
ncbi:MAG: hypothetical protein ACLP0J_16700 [Solirubrobacteraceae bacterium]